jgi:hypothetical protein
VPTQILSRIRPLGLTYEVHLKEVLRGRRLGQSPSVFYGRETSFDAIACIPGYTQASLSGTTFIQDLDSLLNIPSSRTPRH